MTAKRIRIKICGMCHADNIRDVAACGPDYMGFIFYESSPRYVTGQAITTVPPGVEKVGVFVRAAEEQIMSTVDRHHIRMVQLHGDESPGFCERIRQRGLAVIKVFRVDSTFDFSTTVAFESTANYFLFDTKGQKFGGNATRFDWTILEKYNQRVPFFLSGGINPDSIKGLEAIMRMNLHALDLNSGVESSPGLKDIEKVREAISNLNKINHHGIPGR